MPRRPKKKSVAINIQRLSEERLLDTKLVQKKTLRLPFVIAYSAGLGILLGGAILAYLIFTKSPAESNLVPNIILPEAERPTEESPPTTPENQEPVVTLMQVEILETPTGFLNVRTGPGTNFNKITQIQPGEVYELVGEDQEKGWYEIKLDETRTGWVTKQYAKIK